MAQCDTAALLRASSGFAALPPGMLQPLIASLLCKILHAGNPMAVCDIPSLLQDGSCFACLTGGQLQIVIAQLLCEILQGGGTGQVCIICVSAAPVDDGPCDCSLAFGKHGSPVAGSVWTWDVDSGIWDQIIGGP